MATDKNLEVEQFAEMFKALSNPNRLRIFLKLASCCAPGTDCDPENKPKCVGVVGEDLGISPSTISHHIKELRQAGVIRVSRCGQSIHCWVNPEMMQALCDFVHAAKAGNPCCAVVEEPAEDN